ncbi:uncharacterized protein BO72DRAFT_497574 [Aspergillus fijiensis CBS 313.89]|uniref:Uncharacterized protein n=1 Tax=Aspergillus fijiensis CBS 313.89 TaxID=1448319 RepID=A0A8G1VX39_9EURO|nr:uncharacterized protein BO72DRAFT_497574 [Aspergillus fijiensis CBS 313.89]RAK75842.1 hypothetical protein BO72DRAFT_497574 [Aspergillus fijiensis CBS 313.89]
MQPKVGSLCLRLDLAVKELGSLARSGKFRVCGFWDILWPPNHLSRWSSHARISRIEQPFLKIGSRGCMTESKPNLLATSQALISMAPFALAFGMLSEGSGIAAEKGVGAISGAVVIVVLAALTALCDSSSGWWWCWRVVSLSVLVDAGGVSLAQGTGQAIPQAGQAWPRAPGTGLGIDLVELRTPVPRAP